MTRRATIDRGLVREAVAATRLRTSAAIVVAIAPFFIGRVERAAQRAFAQLGVMQTPARNGVLVFVVPARRQVVILSDEGAAGIAAAVWTDIASRIAAAFARGDGTRGLVEGVELLARTLVDAFPDGLVEPVP